MGWYRAFTAIRDALPKPERRYRRCIAVDETKVKQILEYCENKPLFLVDKGPWYREAFERLGLEYRHETPKQGAWNIQDEKQNREVVRHTKSKTQMPARRLPTQLNPQNHNQIHRLVHSNIQLAPQTQPIVTSSLKR
jgi:transposase-like protein